MAPSRIDCSRCMYKTLLKRSGIPVFLIKVNSDILRDLKKKCKSLTDLKKKKGKITVIVIIIEKK